MLVPEHMPHTVALKKIGDHHFAISRSSPIFKKYRKEIAIAKIDELDLAIIARSLVNSLQNSEFAMFLMSSNLKKIISMLVFIGKSKITSYITSFFFYIITNVSIILFIKTSPKRSHDRGAAIAIGLQIYFQMRDLNF